MWQILINSLQEIKVIQSKQYFTALVYKLCYTSTLPTPIKTLKLITNEKLKKTTEIIQGTKIIIFIVVLCCIFIFKTRDYAIPD